MLKKQFVVYGIVQGVGFRYFTWKKATEIGLNGIVKNQRDGSVYILAEGSASQIDSFRDWLSHGPPSARVDRVEENDYSGAHSFGLFSVEH